MRGRGREGGRMGARGKREGQGEEREYLLQRMKEGETNRG